MAKRGERPIALSQELVTWSKYGRSGLFNAGDRIKVVSTDYPNDGRCNGIFVVSDTLNARYTKRADIFFMNRKDNISCQGDIYKL